MAGPTLSSQPREISFERERLRMIFFGDPGVGKTTLAMTAPRPLVVDTDGGLISAAIQGQRGITIEPTGWKDLEGLYWWAKERQDQFETVVFDSITTLQRLLLDEIVSDVGDEKKGRKTVMEFVPEQGMYQANQRQVGRILTDFRRLGRHMILTAGVRDRFGKRAPDVAPGLLSILAHWSSVTGELIIHQAQDGSETRLLLTGPSPQRETKTRFRSLSPLVPNPTFPELWKRVSGEYEEVEARMKATKA